MSSISAAQLSRKNNAVDPQLLATIFLELVAKIKKKKRPDLSNALKIVESTTVSLNPTQFPWSDFRKTRKGKNAENVARAFLTKEGLLKK
ncbi:MAG: hypothetical protein ACE3JK_02925 [Sporolactobacillus sp.]